MILYEILDQEKRILLDGWLDNRMALLKYLLTD